MTDVDGLSASTRWQSATVRQITRQTPLITTFRLKLETPIHFIPGQHADVRLTAPDGYQAIRSYSITDVADGDAEIELAIERLPDGEVSPFFHDVVVVGDIIEARAALGGHFICQVTSTAPALMVGAGSGVAPFIAMLRGRARQPSPPPAALLLSARTYEDILFQDELVQLAYRQDGLSVAFTLTREAPKRASDFHGRINQGSVANALKTLPAAPGTIWICGSNAFVNAAVDTLLSAGQPADIIKTERYGG